MEGKNIVYIAGNPNAYPLEYYNKDSNTYEGVIPQLLHDFSEQSSYEIVYYQPEKGDQRKQLAKNNQVDAISGYSDEEFVADYSGRISLFQTQYGDTKEEYYLYFTDVAPEGLKADLESYFSSVSQEQISGILIQSSAIPQKKYSSYTVSALLFIIAALFMVLVVLIRRYKKKLKEALQNFETDETTGLGNKEYLERYYKQFVNDQNRILYQLFYFYVDTERIKRIANSQEADEFLRFCAVVLQEYTKDMDILAKISEHGFLILKLTNESVQIDLWIHVILERIRQYSQMYQKSFDVNMYVGVYPLQSEDRNLDEMIVNASQSAYLAAQKDIDYVICSEQILQKFNLDKQLQASVEQAFQKHEFQLFIQFYVDADSSKIVGGEALSRWNHPQKGILVPDAFVPLMEQERLISKLDYYCLKEACEFLQSLFQKNIDTFFLSCNFSRETFASVDFPESVKEIIDQYTFPKELLIFEITESTSGKNVTLIQRNIAALKEYGIRVALDDFGEGFTSFYDLQKYPIDGIKLDKGLIDCIQTPNGYAILEAMIGVGHKLNMTILAEGVETEEQVKALKKMRCDVIQGYYYYFPLPEWEAKNKVLEQFLSKKTEL